MSKENQDFLEYRNNVFSKWPTMKKKIKIIDRAIKKKKKFEILEYRNAFLYTKEVVNS